MKTKLRSTQYNSSPWWYKAVQKAQATDSFPEKEIIVSEALNEFKRISEWMRKNLGA